MINVGYLSLFQSLQTHGTQQSLHKQELSATFHKHHQYSFPIILASYDSFLDLK